MEYVIRLIRLVFKLILIFNCGILLYSEEYAIGPVPTWVKPVAADLDASEPMDTSQGIYYLLVDDQARLAASTIESYTHYAIKLLNKTGVEENSRVSIDFDPLYEHVTIHSVQVIRDGKVTNRLDNKNIRVLQRETELEYLIYNGAKSITMLLEDVRIGDCIEVCYTTSGYNPIFQNTYSNSHFMQWSIPVKHVYRRLKKEKPSVLSVRCLNYDGDCKVRYTEDNTDVVWEKRDVKSLAEDENIPGWFDPYPRIELTEYGSWKDVVEWGLTLYNRRIDTDISNVLKTLTLNLTDTEQKILAALSFVQHEIRYLGIEMGQGSYKPSDPNDVVKRRFGDCKDKALLFVSLLKAMRLSAYPVLVNSFDGRSLTKKLPSPLAFNHVIVRLDLESRTYWLDPTLEYQKGDLKNLFQPDYGYGLVLKEGNGKLDSMEKKPYENPTISILQNFDLSGGKKDSAVFTVSSDFLGEDADFSRERFANRTKKEIQDEYLNYYAHDYNNIAVSRDLSFADDEKANKIHIEESYTISGAWKYNETEGREEVEFYPSEVAVNIKKPTTIKRTMPLAQVFPLYVAERITVKLPEGWFFDDDNKEIKNSCFIYNIDVKFKNNTLTILYSYKTLKDHVALNEMEQYIRDTERILDGISYIIWDENKKDSFADIVTPLRIGFFIGLGVVGIIVFFRRRAQRLQK